MAYTISWLTLIIVYVVLSCINIFAVYIYREAYYKMKRTLMIRSVYYLMVALLIENVYFTITAMTVGIDSVVSFILMHPLMWVIPKFILLLSVLYFIYASLTPTIYIHCTKTNK